MKPRVGGSQADLGDGNGQPPAVRLHGLGRVGAQVHDDAVNLGRIGHDVVQAGIHLLGNLDGAGQGGAEQLEGLLDQHAELKGLEFVFVAVAEGQYLADQLGGPQAGDANLLDVLVELRALSLWERARSL
jgi:hypothetical protein